ncbi:thermonuclease family protein [Desulfatibacillum aliphaticivorans]|uniref:thermonuclease family protein n=1 Tax=Desulfatibacillum aliphaticivorans TaxID=218208 RepID=UPI0003F74E50|nr:thermonuclease family protein [Desulfatibacillum aliphaticivorans]
MFQKRCSAVLVWACVVFCLSASVAWGFEGKVVGVSDGDTIKVLDHGKMVKIRIYGVDAPEKKQAFGVKAREFTQSLVAGKIVRVEPQDTDRYGRIVGMVYTLDGRCLNEEIVKAGFAWVYNQYCKQDFCPDWRSFQASAKAGRMGLWADPEPMAPWDYRRSGKKLVASKTAPAGAYSGNVKSGVFHAPGCKYHDCKNCTVSFPNRNAAIQAGYRPCGLCNP